MHSGNCHVANDIQDLGQRFEFQSLSATFCCMSLHSNSFAHPISFCKRLTNAKVKMILKTFYIMSL